MEAPILGNTMMKMCWKFNMFSGAATHVYQHVMSAKHVLRDVHPSNVANTDRKVTLAFDTSARSSET